MTRPNGQLASNSLLLASGIARRANRVAAMVAEHAILIWSDYI
jgi:hypothetical protein